MFGRINFRNRYWLAIIPLTIAAALPFWQSRFEYGWLEMALGNTRWPFWSSLLIWTVCVVVAIKRFRWWWLLLTVPVVFYPVVLTGGLAAACFAGSCP